MKLFETIYAYIIGICEFFAYWYVRIFPPLALMGVIFLFIAAEGAVKQSIPFTLGDGITLLVIGIIFIFMIALWIILHLMEKLENSRPPRHYRKDIDR